MVGSSNSNKNIIRSRCSSDRKSARFRGVHPLNNRKWGARISIKYKAYWLGTYQMEEEAAIAYDRAALKLQRNESPLNFPWKIYTTQEKLFQSWYSIQEILTMIRDKTYSSTFTSFLARQSLASRSIAGGQINAKGTSYQLLFHKKLTQTDVIHIKGFHIPRDYALQYLPSLGNSSDGGQMGSGSIDLTFYDKYCRSWSFRYSYCSSTKTFLFTRGWRSFVAMNNLNPGDTIMFYGCEHVEAGQKRKSYMLDVHRNVAESYIVGRYAEEGIGAYVDGIRGVEKNNGVKLFGVKIG
ncbi:AP2/ERF and B3 domain-containing transcription factor At1g51120-like [Durio zibethinus]|uniref:AP2/ERF and B3 domain-containing transcription factor At1g51120-like n=1 Tax=Durio zibethinus TaxID=66656 RepID=A0A6P5YD35_DURZI|nr:AP2/ERF and B3 domain-containing transcription factor At1g51120-like [Durio zibethinus]